MGHAALRWTPRTDGSILGRIRGCYSSSGSVPSSNTSFVLHGHASGKSANPVSAAAALTVSAHISVNQSLSVNIGRKSMRLKKKKHDRLAEQILTELI